MSPSSTIDKRVLRLTAGNVREGHVPIAGLYDFFPPDIIGGSTKTDLGKPINVILHGMDRVVQTDVGSDAATGKPRSFLRRRTPFRDFYRFHKVHPGDCVVLERSNPRAYVLKASDSFDSLKTSRDELPTVAEFFAGIGLVRLGLERAGFRVIFANDVSATKQAIYAANFGDAHFVCKDVRAVRGPEVPAVDVATASFPCTDLSLAGNREGLAGKHSGLFWEFERILGEMGQRRPRAVLLENVVGLATSNSGEDLRIIVKALNALGYVCDIIALDARRFVAQSRPRLFVIGSTKGWVETSSWALSDARPRYIGDFVARNSDLLLRPMKLPALPQGGASLDEIVLEKGRSSSDWWDADRQQAFMKSLSALQAARLKSMIDSPELTWATAYRRTRNGFPVWELRNDDIAGCLRTTGGGSSKQAIVEAGNGEYRVRWMSAREYARLQGAPGLKFGDASESQVKFALGDAVCVPAISWIAKNCLRPIVLHNS